MTPRSDGEGLLKNLREYHAKGDIMDNVMLGLIIELIENLYCCKASLEGELNRLRIELHH